MGSDFEGVLKDCAETCFHAGHPYAMNRNGCAGADWTVHESVSTIPDTILKERSRTTKA